MCAPEVHARTPDPFTLSCARGSKSKCRSDSRFFIQYRSVAAPRRKKLKLTEYLGTHVTFVADGSLICFFRAYGARNVRKWAV